MAILVNHLLSTGFSSEDAANIVYAAEDGVPPSATELGVLNQFTAAQYAYGQQIGVMDPAIYAYQALGVALASTAAHFQNTFGPFNPTYPASPVGDAQFVTDAYSSIFGHPRDSSTGSALCRPAKLFRDALHSGGWVWNCQ